MAMTSDQTVQGALLDAWDRNNTILLGLLRALPEGGLTARVTPGNPSVAQMLSHIHFVRLILVEENAPEFAEPVPDDEWADGDDAERLAALLSSSARAVRRAVAGRLDSGQDMDRHYDHPVLFLQHLIWHEGYHHGQIKLALQASGQPVSDSEIGPGTWGVWMRKGAV